MPDGQLILEHDKLSQTIRIRGDNLGAGQWAALRLLLSRSRVDAVQYEGRTAILGVDHFLRVLPTLKSQSVRSGISLEAQGVRELVARFVRDRQSLQQASLNTPVDSSIGERLRAAGFMRTLTLEQSRDVLRTTSLPYGANFSVPGAGKTTTLLATHILSSHDLEDPRLLVVCPKNAFGSWDEETKECLGDSFVPVRLRGGSDSIRLALVGNERRVFITNYEQVRIAPEPFLAFMNQHDVHLVLDESHRIKGGVDRATAAAVLDIAPAAFRRDILSGTPMPQGMQDLVPQFDFLWVGQGIVESILSAAPDEARLVELANKRLAPLFVRTTKNELKLPPYEVERVPVDLPGPQSELYELIRSESARLLAGLSERDSAALRRMKRQVVRLLQAASNPALIAKSVVREPTDGPDEFETDIDTLRSLLIALYENGNLPGKIVATEQRVRELASQGRKSLVWSIFIDNIEFLRERLSDLGAVTIHGSIDTGDELDPDTREGRIRLFKTDPECQVMIANPAACGEGISLHKVCHDAIYLDRNFRAEHYLQSIDRIHRLGLKPNERTTVHILQARDTIDAVVDQRLEAKIDRMLQVLESHTISSVAYDPEDVDDKTVDGLELEDSMSLLEHLRATDA